VPTPRTARCRLKPPDIVREAVTVVIVGRFEPLILSPSWLLSQDLIGREQSDSAEIQIAIPQASAFSAGWLRFEASAERISLTTEDPTAFYPLRDLAVGILTILKKTAVGALGINRAVHVRVPSLERWHAVGDTLAPKAPWEGALTLPGMLSLTVQGTRDDAYPGYVQVKVESSSLVVPGIFAEQNDHFLLKRVSRQPASREDFDQAREGLEITLSPDSVPVAIEILSDEWDRSLRRSAQVVSRIWETGGSR
jgi:hypothetical protein